MWGGDGAWEWMFILVVAWSGRGRGGWGAGGGYDAVGVGWEGRRSSLVRSDPAREGQHGYSMARGGRCVGGRRQATGGGGV